MATAMADREADIYEMFDRLPDTANAGRASTHVLVRACANRSLQRQGQERGRSAHRAQLVVRFGRTQIRRPQWADRSAAGSIGLWAVEVCEAPSSVLSGEKPVHWRLLTTHEIASKEQARQCIDWYRQRGHIEQHAPGQRLL